MPSKIRRPYRGLSLALWVLLLTGACQDNIGRVFDRGAKGKGGTASVRIVPPPKGGIVREERPKVLRAAPQGSGWAPTTPVFVLFSESMNRDSLVRPSAQGKLDHLHVRAKGTTQALAGTYDLLLGGRLLVFRPQVPFPSQGSFEIVAGKNVRDLDRAIVAKTGVLAEFRANAAAGAKPLVVFRYPEDLDTEVPREDPCLLGFSMPVDPASVGSATFHLRPAGETKALSAGISMPLKLQSAPDPRLFLLQPSNPLPARSKLELRYTSGIKAGKLTLDPGKKDPPVTFKTADPLSPLSVAIGNPTSGFADKVNLANLSNLRVDVEVPADTRAGDEILLRVYGRDPKGKSASDLKLKEIKTRVPAPGKQTVAVTLTGVLGAVGATTFKDGELTLAARLARGRQLTGFVLAPSTVQDTVRPTLVSLGPPTGTGSQVFLTDLNATSLYGKASEPLGALSLVAGSGTYGLFASRSDGRFQSKPFFLGRTTTPTAFSLNLTDEAGNLSAGAVNGTFVQRGFVTGNLNGGKLVVEVYDESTLLAISGVTVLIEAGMPAKPPVSRQSKTTGTDGRATFTGLTGSNYTITAVHGSYHLRSLLALGAGHVSLPLRPLRQATATLSASLGFTALPGIRARAGINILDDETANYSATTTNTSPATLASLAVRPNRPLCFGAFAGPVPPTVKPTYALYSIALAATSGGKGANRAPPAPVGPAGAYNLVLPLSSSLNTFANLQKGFSLDLSTVLGLDTASLTGPPEVVILSSLGGFPGMVLAGPGFANGSGTNWTLDASYSLSMLVDFAVLGPISWLCSTTRDTKGNLVRHRALIADSFAGTVTDLASPLGIPTVLAPAGAFTGSPSIEVEDRLDATAVANTLAFRRIVARDGTGRTWTLLYLDGDGKGGRDTIQFPDLSGTGVTGLAKGTWKIQAADRLLLAPGLSPTEWNFEDLPRLELGFARSVEVAFTIQ